MSGRPDFVGYVRDADSADLPALMCMLVQAQAVALARMRAAQLGGGGDTAAPSRALPAAPSAPDVNLSADEAARRLGVSIDYLYKAKNLPFRRRIGRRVLFSAAGLERWNRQRTERS